ncbi:MAG: hypothetical protein HY791_10820 [Deltaproteobacteria bacterium]|nr:hypothetical protein [Deltaproteobacteria bacterium]
MSTPDPSRAELAQVTTLEELFPGRLGRLQMVRIMLRLREVGLDKYPRDQPLPPDLLGRLRRAIREDEEAK